MNVPSYQLKSKFLKIFFSVFLIFLVLALLLMPLLEIKLKKKYFFLQKGLLDSILHQDIQPPVLSGRTVNGGYYHISAKKITNTLFDLSQSHTSIDLLRPVLLYHHTDKDITVKAISESAIYHPDSHTVNIDTPIDVFTNRSYSARLKNMLINLSENNIQTDGSVKIQFNNHILTAEGMIISNDFNKIVFKGPVDIQREIKGKS